LFSINAFSSAENHGAQIASKPLERISQKPHSSKAAHIAAPVSMGGGAVAGCPVISVVRRVKKSTRPHGITSKHKIKMLLRRLFQPIGAQSQQIDFSRTNLTGEAVRVRTNR
jgi:hypothetical protein